MNVFIGKFELKSFECATPTPPLLRELFPAQDRSYKDTLYKQCVAADLGLAHVTRPRQRRPDNNTQSKYSAIYLLYTKKKKKSFALIISKFLAL